MQVAPRELLVRRNELSAITQRALMTHNLAMEITNVSAAEFPDPHVFASGDRFQVRSTSGELHYNLQ